MTGTPGFREKVKHTMDLVTDSSIAGIMDIVTDVELQMCLDVLVVHTDEHLIGKWKNEDRLMPEKHKPAIMKIVTRMEERGITAQKVRWSII